MKIVFAGTPTFAALALQALIDSQHEIVGVYTQPDKPSGRGLHMALSPVKTLALAHQLPIFQPKTLHDDSILASLDADIMVVTAYGLLLPVSFLETPRLGSINIHPSLLPR